MLTYTSRNCFAPPPIPVTRYGQAVRQVGRVYRTVSVITDVGKIVALITCIGDDGTIDGQVCVRCCMVHGRPSRARDHCKQHHVISATHHMVSNKFNHVITSPETASVQWSRGKGVGSVITGTQIRISPMTTAWMSCESLSLPNAYCDDLLYCI